MRAFLPLLLLVACGTEGEVPRGTSAAPESADPPSASTAPSQTPSPSPGTTVTTYDSPFGPMLFDRSGQAIYLFDAETTTEPECYDECAEAWPPVLTRGDPVATGQVRAGLLGTTRRSDGSRQVTYGGHPLYFYAHEGKRQVLCHDIEEYGGTWLVVQPDGRAAPS